MTKKSKKLNPEHQRNRAKRPIPQPPSEAPPNGAAVTPEPNEPTDLPVGDTSAPRFPRLTNLRVGNLGRSRFGHYYIRHSHIGPDGRRRVVQRSLRTNDPEVAKALALALNLRRAVVGIHAQRNMPAQPAQVRLTTKDFGHEQLRQLLTASAHPFTVRPPMLAGEHSASHERGFENAAEGHWLEGFAWEQWMSQNTRAAALIKGYEINLETGVIKAEGEEEHRRAMEAMVALKAAQAERLSKVIERGIGSSHSPFEPQHSTVVTVAGTAADAAADTELMYLRRRVKTQRTLAELITHFNEDPDYRKSTPRNIKDRDSYLQEFLAFSEGRSLAEVLDVSFVNSWRTRQSRLRSKKDPAQGLSEKTLEKRTGYICTFFDWLKSKSFLEGDNPFKPSSRSKVYGGKAINQYKDFTQYELGLLFGAGYKVHMGGKPDFYWVPLIAWLTGARLGEICGLKLSDFEVQDDVQMFSITKGKTQSSVRRVPVHSALMQLGLMDYVASRREQKADRFMGHRGSVACAKAVGRAWAAWVDRCGIQGEKKVFHSLRSTCITALYERKATAASIRHTVGHSSPALAGSHGDYIRDISPKACQEALNSRELDHVVIEGLRLKDPTFKQFFSQPLQGQDARERKRQRKANHEEARRRRLGKS